MVSYSTSCIGFKIRQNAIAVKPLTFTVSHILGLGLSEELYLIYKQRWDIVTSCPFLRGDPAMEWVHEIGAKL